MPVYRISELNQKPHSGNIFSGGVMIHLKAGADIAAHFSDHFNFYFVIEGNATALEESVRREISTGDVFVVSPGIWHSVGVVAAPVHLLHLTGPSCPPFRSGDLSAGSAPTIITAPFRLPKSSRRFGVSISFDETKSFSPMMLAASPGGDLVLTLNVDSLVRNHAEEIRRHCLSSRRTLAALILRLVNDREIEEFPLHSSQGFLVSMLRPVNLGIQANLATEAGRHRAGILLNYWCQPLAIEAIRPCIRMPIRDWSESEAASLFRFLDDVAPASFGIILQLLSGGLRGPEGFERYLGALLPWLAGVECRDTGTLGDLRELLDSVGFQGWLLKTL